MVVTVDPLLESRVAADWPSIVPLEFATLVPLRVSSADNDFPFEGLVATPLDVPEVWLPLPETRVDSDFKPVVLSSR